MSSATGQANGGIARPVPSETPRDFYDPHFPTRQNPKEVSERKRTETFDPYFPQRSR